LQQKKNQNTLFIFNDNDTRLHGDGWNVGIVRKLDRFHKKITDVRSAGIPTGNLHYGGFMSLNEKTMSFMNNNMGTQIEAKEIIDIAMMDIFELLKTKRYNQVLYPGHVRYYDEWIDVPDLFGTNTFKIGSDVNEYIIQQLRQTIFNANKYISNT
jgi:hypothetical protein